MNPDDLTTEKLDADMEACWALLRAKGVPLPDDPFLKTIFKLGFNEGAGWANQIIREARK